MNKAKLNKIMSVFWLITSLLLTVLFSRIFYLNGWEESQILLIPIPLGLFFAWSRWKQYKSEIPE